VKEIDKFNSEFQNIEKGFDPLGGRTVKTKEVNQDDDDLLGWDK